MSGTFMDKITANKNSYAEKLAQYGINNNPNMKDFGDFKDALISGLSGSTAPNYLTEDELVELFKQPNVRETIEQNIGKKEADEIYRIAERTDYVVTRQKPIGEPTTKRDVKFVIVGKPIRSRGYTNTRTGKNVNPYNRTYKKWSGEEINFLKQKKTLLKQKRTTISQIAFEYNKEFKSNHRSSSSIQTRLYRL